MRARKAATWVLLASIVAYLVIMVAGPLQLIGPAASVYIGSIAALGIALGAAAFVVVFLVTQNRRSH